MIRAARPIAAGAMAALALILAADMLSPDLLRRPTPTQAVASHSTP